jgi:SAM-dependent methyltransferase
MTETTLVLAQRIGNDWQGAPYYQWAEAQLPPYWDRLILPFLTAGGPGEVDFSRTVDLAAGHGRNTVRLLDYAQRVWTVDILASNIAVCEARFAQEPRVSCHVNDGVSLDFLPAHSVTLVYCFDAMVHFDSDVIRAYLRDFRRVLVPGGHAFLHHSNYTGAPGGDYQQNPHWRNFMSRELMAHYARKEGLEVARQQLMDWQGDGTDLDCFTLLRQPG